MANTNTYFSDFYPPVVAPGAKGSTIAPVTSGTVDGIITDIGKIGDTILGLNKSIADIEKEIADIADGATGDTVPPGVPTNLALSSTLTDVGVDLVATWNPPSDDDLAGYDIAIKEGSADYINFMSSSATYKWLALRRNTKYTVKVRAYDKSGNRGAYTTDVEITTVRDTTPPAPVNTIAAETTYESAFITWYNPADTDLRHVRIELYNSSNQKVKSIDVPSVPGTSGSTIFTGLPKGATFYVKAYAVDTSYNEAPVVQSGNFTTVGGIDLNDFTPGLQPIKTVANLPDPNGYNGASVVFNQADGKLYRYANGQWTKATDATDISGPIASENLVNVKVGGGNLVHNSRLLRSRVMSSNATLANGFGPYNNAADNEPTIWSINVGGGRQGDNSQVVSFYNNTTTKGVFFDDSGDTYNSRLMRPRTAYVISVYARATNNAIGGNVGTAYNIHPASIRTISNPPLTTEYQRYVYAIVTGDTVDPQNVFWTLQKSITGQTTLSQIEYTEFQIEEGDIATAYAPGLLDGEITQNLIAPAAVNTVNLADAAITNTKLSQNSVTTEKLVDQAISLSKFADGLTPVMRTATLPPNPKVGQVIMFTPDNKLYRFTGTEWSKATDGADIVANSLTAQAIAAGTITGDKIAANTINARSLAIGNFDNIIPDGDMRDVTFWNGGAYSENSGIGQVWLYDQNSQWRYARMMRISGPIDATWVTPFFPVEIGATYKLEYQIYFSPDFNGWLNISLHHPSVSWRSIKTGFSGYDPTVNYTEAGSHTFHNGDTAFGPNIRTFVIPGEANNQTRRTQFRFDGHWTQGYVEFMVSIVRVSDATLIGDGAIETNKIAANAITADKIAANSIAANKLVVASRPVSMSDLNLRYENGVLKWNAGNVVTVDNNGNAAVYYVNGGSVVGSGYLLYSPGSDHLEYNNNPSYVADPAFIKIAYYDGGLILNVIAGASTVINGANIVTGTINADKIAANTITASKLVVGDFTKLNPDPRFRDTDLWYNQGLYNNQLDTGGGNYRGWYNRHGPDIDAFFGADSYVMLWSDAMSLGASRQHLFSQMSYGISPNTVYELSAKIRNASNQTIYVYCRMFDSSGGFLADASVSAAPGAFDTYKVQFTSYPRATRYYFILFNEAGSTFTGNAQVADVQVTKAAGVTLIQDNAISTGKLAALAVNANKLAANAVTADKIAANSIAANKLMIGNRPFSLYATRFYVDNNGYMQWGSGYVQYPSTDGGYSSVYINGGTWAPGGPVVYMFYRPGASQIDFTYDETVQNDSSVFFVGKWHGNKEGPVLSSGVGTLINGEQIITESLRADRIIARTITGDKIAANAITANELAANSITAGKLSIQTKPISVSGVNIRIDPNGALVWDAGTITFPDSNGNYVMRTVTAGSMVWQGWDKPVNFCYNSNLDNTGLAWIYYSQDLPSYPEMIPVAVWAGGQDLAIKAGVSTIINGDRIVTGTINANKITSRSITADRLASNSITANEIQAGTITAAQIASDAITARVLAIGNPDNIVGDSGFRDAAWWNSGINDGRLSVGDSGMNVTGRELKIVSNGRTDFFSMFFPVELGATYKVSVGVYTTGDFSGNFRPVIHMPSWAWLSLKAGYPVDPEDSNPALNWSAANSYFTSEFTITNPANTLPCRQWQFRLIGDWSGTLAFVCKIVRVSDTTLIANGAITTEKITVNSLNGDRIAVGTLNADRIAANSILANNLVISGTTTTLGTVNAVVSNPAYYINTNSTNIDPGRILISGGTTLANWRNGGDNTKIEGGSIAANTVTANKLTIGNRGIGFIGLNFEWNPTNNHVYWSEGQIYYVDDAGNPAATGISAGNSGGEGAHLYFFWIKGEGYIRRTKSLSDAMGDDRIMLASWWGGSNLNANYGGTIINGDRITTGTINADKITAGSITGDRIAANTIYGALIASDNIIGRHIAAGNVTADKISVNSLDALSATIGTLRTATSGQRTEINNNGMKTFASNGNLVFQCGIY